MFKIIALCFMTLSISSYSTVGHTKSGHIRDPLVYKGVKYDHPADVLFKNLDTFHDFTSQPVYLSLNEEQQFSAKYYLTSMNYCETGNWIINRDIKKSSKSCKKVMAIYKELYLRGYSWGYGSGELSKVDPIFLNMSKIAKNCEEKRLNLAAVLNSNAKVKFFCNRRGGVMNRNGGLARILQINLKSKTAENTNKTKLANKSLEKSQKFRDQKSKNKEHIKTGLETKTPIKTESARDKKTKDYKLAIEHYERGIALIKNKDKKHIAIEYLKKSSILRHPRASFILSFYYFNPKEKEYSPEKGMEWLTLSSNLNYAEAQHTLGHNFQDGKNTAKNLKKAAYWFQRAANQNHAKSQSHLAHMLYYGNGVSQNKTEAFRLNQLAARHDIADAHYFLGLWYLKGDNAYRNKNLSNQWFKKAASLLEKESTKGNIQASYRLAYLYDQGYGIPEDNAYAAMKYLELAKKGHVPSQYSVAILYIDGEGVKQNREQAKQWLTKAASKGYKPAKALLKKINRNQ